MLKNNLLVSADGIFSAKSSNLKEVKDVIKNDVILEYFERHIKVGKRICGGSKTDSDKG